MVRRQSGRSFGTRARIGREDELHDLIEHEAEADRRQQRRDARLALQGPQPDALDQHADQRAGDERRSAIVTGSGVCRNVIAAQPT